MFTSRLANKVARFVSCGCTDSKRAMKTMKIRADRWEIVISDCQREIIGKLIGEYTSNVEKRMYVVIT